MLPVVTPDEMRVIDVAARLPHADLVERAGGAVARAAVRLLGGTYGRVVVVLAGPGSNGADGRVAARLLEAQGVLVRVVDVTAAHPAPPSLEGLVPSPIDLVIDAVYGTGFRDSWSPPEVDAIPVLAVDVPSGVDSLTGEVRGAALRATATITFAALKPGLLFGQGRQLAGTVEIVPAPVVGLGDDALGSCTAFVVEADDIAGWVPARATDAHKWHHAVKVVAGSPAMPGAAHLVAAAALRGGAGMVHVTSPHGLLSDLPIEVVQADTPIERFGALVVGPGLGRSATTARTVSTMIESSRCPMVLDGDALSPDAHLDDRIVVTPHDGEYATLAGAPPSADRIGSARRLATRLGCTVVLKGPATVIAAPDGRVLVSLAGDARLATAGSGDVLAGLIAALLCRGVPPLEAAAAAAFVHGLAAHCCPTPGTTATDLLDALPEAWHRVLGGRR